jgi:hypothetical protein
MRLIAIALALALSGASIKDAPPTKSPFDRRPGQGWQLLIYCGP